MIIACVVCGIIGVVLLLVSAFLDGDAYRWLRLAAWSAIAVTCVLAVIAAVRSERRQRFNYGRSRSRH